jgi:uridine kinase
LEKYRMFRIGIAGGSGSGKTTLVKRLLAKADSTAVAVLSHDSYYRNRSEMPATVCAPTGDSGRDAVNWDHPDSLDNALFASHIDDLAAGRPIPCPMYDFQTDSRSPVTRTVEPKPVLIVEGILLLAIPEIRDRLDLKVYIDTPDDLRIVRRMLRDVRDRQRSVESVAGQYTATVRAMHLNYVEPSRRYAQILVPWDSENPAAVDLIVARIRMATGSQTGTA